MLVDIVIIFSCIMYCNYIDLCVLFKSEDFEIFFYIFILFKSFFMVGVWKLDIS